jgi:ElaB/YqjD/DUF883 family membrane-anchored ribosome-binding protein
MTQQSYPLDYSQGAERDKGAQGTMDRVKEAATEYAGKVADQAREYGEQAQEAARDFKPYVEKSMKEQPMATLAVASVIGFMLGALWKK